MGFEGRYIKKGSLEPRPYQENIADSCLNGSTLVVLPTGLGKTVIALIAIARTLERSDNEMEKVLILAPTRPLVEQHKVFMERFLEGLTVRSFTGDLSPQERDDAWKVARVIVSTPQVIQNDLLTGRYDLKDVPLVIFDEAHRARGNYSYVHVAQIYRRNRQAADKHPLTMGTTASPGGTTEAIREVCENLGFVRTEVRSEEDPDVKPYVHKIEHHWCVVDLSFEHKEVAKAFRLLRDRFIVELHNSGFLERSVNISTKSILEARDRIQDAIERCRRVGPSGLGTTKDDEISCLIRLSMVQSQVMTLNHAIEMAETQGPEPLRAFLSRLKDKSNPETWSRSTEDLLKDEKMQEAMELADGLLEHHPKFDAVKDVLTAQFQMKRDSRIIVFAHYRDTAEALIMFIMGLEGVRPCRFVGQADRGEDKGLSQKEQAEVLTKFRDGTFNVLVATSVAEEGLDIPSTDMVVFYEPVASEIRAIQRRGRTGRARSGRVEFMMTRGTKDEAAYWASRAKEKKMHTEIEQLKKGVVRAIEGAQQGPDRSRSLSVQTTLPSADLPFPWARTEPSEEHHQDTKNEPVEGVSIIVDHREVPSSVALELNKLGVTVESKQLDTGDYILSDRVAVERKATRDFLGSLIDGRLFQQLSALRSAYQRPLLIIEGSDIRSDRAINPAAIDGALSSIIVDLGIPVLRTRDPHETAQLLLRIARREHSERRMVSVRKIKPKGELRARLRLVIEGLPTISATLSDRLLTHFGNIKAIVDASPEQLQEVRGIGPLTAVAVHRLLRADYNDAYQSNGRRIPEGSEMNPDVSTENPKDTKEGQVREVE
jgi:ERCC4-related helicase/ERCC4-type nuclease